MKAKAIRSIFFLTTMFFSSLSAQTPIPKDPPGTTIFVMSNSSNVQVKTRKLTHTEDAIQVTMEVPQIIGLSDKKFQKKLNRTWLKQALELKNQAIETAREYNKDLLEAGLNPVKFELVTNYTVIPSMPYYLTIHFLEYNYSGGAHGISYQKYVTIDMINQKVLALKDLFQPNTPYQKKINEIIKKQIIDRTKQGEYFFEGEAGFQEIRQDQPYYVTPEGDLVILFDYYEIAPYAAGIIAFTIPRTELTDIL